MPGQQHQPVIEVKNLTIEFSNGATRHCAVEKLNFTLQQGEIMGIVGESGSGKSVTALSLMKLLPCPPAHITDGEILFYEADGQCTDMVKAGEKAMRTFRGRRISMIFQEPMTSLNPVYRCGEQVQEVITTHNKVTSKEARQRVLALFEEVQLPDPLRIYKAYPHQLSGGQKQRVMIAMAIANNPSVIIADEPTTALDVTVQKTILNLLKSIRDKYGLSIIFITHDLGVVAEIADTALVMYKGRCVEKGNIAALFNKPAHPYTRGLLACKPNRNFRLQTLPTVSDFLNEDKQAGTLPSANSVIISNEARRDAHEALYSGEPLLSVKKLNVYFDAESTLFSGQRNKKHILKDITFDVYKGETLGLVGESGCGKTTLGRALLRLIEVSSGEVFYKNANINLLKKEAFRKLRKQLQIIFQDPYSSLNPRLTVGEAIAEPMRVHKLARNATESRAKVVTLLEKVGLDGSCYNRYPHEFSGGQRQRIVIARTLALEPEFIICDESVSALDVSVQAQVLNLLNKLKSEFGLTYIFISHDLSVVKYLADRIIIMKQGEIVEMNEADALYSSPQHPYTQKLIHAIPGK